MLRKHIILIISAVTCVAAAWYVRIQNPTFQYAPLFTTCVIAATIYVYWKTNTPTKKCVSTTGEVGVCELDSDCNKVDPKAQCYKDAAGACGCRCSPGYSGTTCQIKGIPWNDPSCMGPNKQSPKNKSGLCVCPDGNWESGTTGSGQYVQCLKCGGSGEWGPYAATGAPNACTGQWKNLNLVSDTCVYRQTSNPSLFCEDLANKYQTGYPNSQGDIPTVKLADQVCIGESCKCSGNNYQLKIPTGRGLCSVTGWIEPTITAQTCNSPGINSERACSSYQCKGWTG